MQLTIILAIVAISVISQAIKIIREDERMVVMRSGEYHATRGPGLTYLIPFLEQATMVDLGRTLIDIPPQTVTTRDDIDVSIGFDVIFKIIDPKASVMRMQENPTENIALEELQSVISEIAFDDIKQNQQEINSTLLNNLNQRTMPSGMQTLDVMIGDIELANDAPVNGAD